MGRGVRGQRGGIGVRKSIEERQSRSTHYRLTAVPVGSIIAECLDRYRRWELGHRLGVLARNSTDSVLVRWEGEETYTRYTAGDARYRVDTNLWRISPPPPRNVFDALSGDVRHAGLPALTSEAGVASIASSPPTEGEGMTEEIEMPPKKKSEAAPPKKATEKPEQPPAPQETEHKERETYTAKQVATRIGTDAKTLRKFFRSPASTVEAVGQGGRYEFKSEDMPQIREEFDKWKSGKAPRATKPEGSKTTRSRGNNKAAQIVEEDDEALDLDEDDEIVEDEASDNPGEPNGDDLAEIDDEDLDLELDDEDDE